MTPLFRHYSADDLEQVKALHAKQGLDYELPDLEKPSMLVRVVIEDEGRIRHAAFLRKTTEAYWLFDPAESRRERLGNLVILHKEMQPIAERMGIEDVHIWPPPEALEANPAFAATMLRLGWEKPLWPCYTRKVK